VLILEEREEGKDHGILKMCKKEDLAEGVGDLNS
jgi:hypothetical protein